MSDHPEIEARVTDITPKRLRADADNIAHGDRSIYPVGSLLDAADTITRLRADLATLEAALRVCDDALATIERRTLDDFPPYRVAPVEAFLPIIREARAMVEQTIRATPAEGGE